MSLLPQLCIFFVIFQTTSFLVSAALFECNANSTNPSSIAYTITVNPSGGGNFTTITDAINFIPSRNNQWVKIALSPGIYKEKIHLGADKNCIVLEGQDRNTTIITFDDHDTTSQSVTFAADPDYFVAKNITFRNSYNIPLRDTPQVVPAVAFGSFGDKQAFFSCGFEGYQDTLWDDKGRHYFKSCYIQGAVDFIWGNGQSVYEGCAINVTGGGYITAQGRASANDPSGYVFRGCKVSGPGHGPLGRAYGPYSRVIFIDSDFSAAVDPAGWFEWKQGAHENDITYAEIHCTGPGADMSKRVTWEKKIHNAKEFTTSNFIDQEGWIAKLP